MDTARTEPRPEKVAIVAEVRERLAESSSVLVTEYRGLSVKAMADLRRTLRPAGGTYKVYKNTLVRRAANEAGFDLDEHLVGPTALAFTGTTPDGSPGDVVSVAKVLKEFARTNPALVVKGGLLDGAILDADQVRRLADIEPREVLLAKLAGLMAAPMTQFAGLLQAVPRNFAYGLKALIEQGGADGAPASSAPAEAEADSPADDEATAADPVDEVVSSEPTPEPAEAPADDAAQNENNEDGDN